MIFGVIFLCPPFLKRIILKSFCGASFGRGSSIGWFSAVVGDDIRLGEFSTIKPFTLIRCDGEVRLGSYSEVSSFNLIYGCGSFIVGDKCYIGPQSLINVTEDVIIGNNVGIGAKTMIYTHGSFLPYTEGYWVKFGKVIIGNNVWLAAGVFIQPGVEIGQNVFANSRSVITKNIETGMVVQGFPAKEIGSIESLRRQVSPGKRDDLIKNVLKHFIKYMKQTRKAIVVKHAYDEMLVFDLFDNRYVIGLINHKGASHEEMKKVDCRRIALVNSSDGCSLPSADKVILFDFISMEASFSKDRVFQDLYMFFRQYYGLIFQYK